MLVCYFIIIILLFCRW